MLNLNQLLRCMQCNKGRTKLLSALWTYNIPVFSKGLECLLSRLRGQVDFKKMFMKKRLKEIALELDYKIICNK